MPIFRKQIAAIGPVTVTNPDVTRYFMTIPEAVGLGLQSFVFWQDIELKFTGLKPSEKIFEELRHHTESHVPTNHPRVMRFTGNAIFRESGVRELERRLYELDANQLKAILRRLVPEYTPFLD